MHKFRTTKKLFSSLLYLFYPENCAACDNPLVNQEDVLCLNCIYKLPLTNFTNFTDNEVSRLFWGRVEFEYAYAYLKYLKKGIAQKLLQQLKYHGKGNIGIKLGKLTGNAILNSPLVNADIILPVPLNPRKQLKRGYNQSEKIATGISAITNIPLFNNILCRNKNTDTQTTRSRYQRWENVSGVFSLNKKDLIKNKHILLVDDVVTTGSTLEACGNVLLNNGAKQVSIVTIAYATR